MVTAYQGTIQDGQIRLDNTPELPEGARVILVVVGKEQEQKFLTLGDLLESPLVGMWADREDIADSAEFARQLRERASRRE
jgi:hypothetical protein